ncbi:MAG TPA: 50S ribosomal protein L18 [Coriobacteriia bacterium]|jgi:large subunit ribosomal protein L18|uniref:50S ribosomal protein L18 n=1 Tax=Anaerosoma tenue TaxID=2933588 RepID=UPI00076BC49F|nr:50S ribosomal protein L18 [Anaerosoma tenue]KUK47647.1 MAG: 50S ribosomal protein L18 [Actinobacteria bacterium 66_15]MCK8115631.1 50S ribosomal protein L18 [Anaerosoma tenue]HAL30626.1 50S ribosomal protein L18 [Coriobacteriia bacterium]HHJ99349.1 50S ribosomal protein L18 [Actinomycetota bacterium]
MDKSKAKTAALTRRQRRVRGKVAGTAERPRLRVSRSNQHIYAQLIDDVAGATLVSASSIDPELRTALSSGANADAAKAVGGALGRRALEAGITEVVFDRGGRLYHGRVAALAEGARDAGLKF